MPQVRSLGPFSLALILMGCAAVPAPVEQSLIQPPRPLVPLSTLVYPADYPVAAAASRQEGTVHFRLTIGIGGRATGCAITRSSGSRHLDSATCALMVRRAKFIPARGPSGSAREGTFADSLVWRL